MSRGLWTRFLRTKGGEDSSDHGIDKKELVKDSDVTVAIEVSPGGLSFEEGLSVLS